MNHEVFTWSELRTPDYSIRINIFFTTNLSTCENCTTFSEKKENQNDIELDNKEIAQRVVKESLEKGLILFYFLFTKTAIRITPPLTISDEDIIKGCEIIKGVLD